MMLDTQAQQQAQPQPPLDVRLWNLLRIRRSLTAEDAAQTLIDADTPDWAAQRRKIAARLSAWAKHAPQAVGRGAKRQGGCIRYVLLEGADPGRCPPPSRAAKGQP